MSAQAVFGWWRKAVETERDRPRLIGCREGISRVKTTHQQGERNCTRWRTQTAVWLSANLLKLDKPLRRIRPSSSRRC